LAVEGVGAVPLPVPPIDEEYHKRLLPCAVNGEVLAFWQYEMLFVTVGALGIGFTITANADSLPKPQVFLPFTVMFPDCALLAKFAFILLVVLLPETPLGNVHE